MKLFKWLIIVRVELYVYFIFLFYILNSLIRLLWLSVYWNYGRSFVNFKNRVMFEKQYFLKNAYRYVFENTHNITLNTLICITGEFCNNLIIFLRDVARWIQGALEIRVSVLGSFSYLGQTFFIFRLSRISTVFVQEMEFFFKI